MTQLAKVCSVALGSVLTLTAAVNADVVIRGPFGRQIVVPSPSDVHIGPGVRVNPAPGYPAAGPLPGETVEPPLAVGPAPAPVMVAPQPANPGPQTAADFVRTFKPAPGSHQVTLLHTRTNQPVTIAFELPQGEPRVLSYSHSILFDYGRQEVEIRFMVGGKVKVTTFR